MPSELASALHHCCCGPHGNNVDRSTFVVERGRIADEHAGRAKPKDRFGPGPGNNHDLGLPSCHAENVLDRLPILTSRDRFSTPTLRKAFFSPMSNHDLDDKVVEGWFAQPIAASHCVDVVGGFNDHASAAQPRRVDAVEGPAIPNVD